MSAQFDLKQVYYPGVSAKIGWDSESLEFILQVDAKMPDDTTMHSVWRTKHLRNIVTVCEHQYAIVDQETLKKLLVEANSDIGRSEIRRIIEDASRTSVLSPEPVEPSTE